MNRSAGWLRRRWNATRSSVGESAAPRYRFAGAPGTLGERFVRRQAGTTAVRTTHLEAAGLSIASTLDGAVDTAAGPASGAVGVYDDARWRESCRVGDSRWPNVQNAFGDPGPGVHRGAPTALLPSCSHRKERKRLVTAAAVTSQ